MRRVPALAVGLLFLASVSVPAIDAASPTLASTPTTPAVQEFVDSLLKIAEVQQAFEPGDTVEIQSGNRSWSGSVLEDGTLPIEAGSFAATHTLIVDPAAMMSIINAYNMPNTAKLAVKAQYMVARSERQAVMTAIGAVARTPLDERLPTTTPTAGNSITFQGCTGALAAYEEGRFVVTLCDDRYTVNMIGGFTSILPRAHLVPVGEDDGEGDDPGRGESYGPDHSSYEDCVAEIGPKPKKGDYSTKKKWKKAKSKWNQRLADCVEGF